MPLAMETGHCSNPWGDLLQFFAQSVQQILVGTSILLSIPYLFLVHLLSERQHLRGPHVPGSFTLQQPGDFEAVEPEYTHIRTEHQIAKFLPSYPVGLTLALLIRTPEVV
jgi:hypothetical protein